jgi:hypothetical protein
MSETVTDSLKPLVEQLQVQLAGCLAAAEGWPGKPPLKPSEYGWSLAYQKVVELRQRFEDSQVLVENYRKANERFATELGEQQKKYDQLLELFNRMARLDEQSTAARPHEHRAIEAEYRALTGAMPTPTRRTEP